MRGSGCAGWAAHEAPGHAPTPPSGHARAVGLPIDGRHSPRSMAPLALHPSSIHPPGFLVVRRLPPGSCGPAHVRNARTPRRRAWLPDYRGGCRFCPRGRGTAGCCVGRLLVVLAECGTVPPPPQVNVMMRREPSRGCGVWPTAVLLLFGNGPLLRSRGVWGARGQLARRAFAVAAVAAGGKYTVCGISGGPGVCHVFLVGR
jgi:hypothetical protein